MWEVRPVKYIDGNNIKIDFKEIYFNSEHKVQAISTKSINLNSTKNIMELFDLISKLNISLTKTMIIINKRTGEILEGNINVGYYRPIKKLTPISA